MKYYVKILVNARGCCKWLLQYPLLLFTLFLQREILSHEGFKPRAGIQAQGLTFQRE